MTDPLRPLYVYADPGGPDETVYVSPYPEDCQPIPQKLKLGEEPRYVNEVWWLVGDHHFERHVGVGR